MIVLVLFLSLPKLKQPLIGGLKSVDWLGSLSVLGFTVTLLLGLQFGGVSFPWSSPKVICLIIFGLAMIAIFLFCEAKVADHPVMPLGLFKQRSNIAALLVCFFHGFVGCTRGHNTMGLALIPQTDLHLGLLFPSSLHPSSRREVHFDVWCTAPTNSPCAVVYRHLEWGFYAQNW